MAVVLVRHMAAIRPPDRCRGCWHHCWRSVLPRSGPVLGSVRLLSDANGQLLGSLRYSPFGEVEQQTGSRSPLGFTGQMQDAASGLTYLRARDYDPALGRFLTPDAMVPNPANGQAWNAYAYAYNDGVNLVDPSGFAPGPLSSEFWSDWGNQIGRGAQVVNNWWNKPPPCDCSRQDNSWVTQTQFLNRLVGELYGTLGLGYIISSADVILTQQQRSRQLAWGLGPRNQIVRPAQNFTDWNPGAIEHIALPTGAQSVPTKGDFIVTKSLYGDPVEGVDILNVRRIPRVGGIIGGANFFWVGRFTA